MSDEIIEKRVIRFVMGQRHKEGSNHLKRCMCVCVCVRGREGGREGERERQRERGRERERERERFILMFVHT